MDWDWEWDWGWEWWYEYGVGYYPDDHVTWGYTDWEEAAAWSDDDLERAYWERIEKEEAELAYWDQLVQMGVVAPEDHPEAKKGPQEPS